MERNGNSEHLAFGALVARTSLPLGTAGRIRTYRTAAGWTARVLFRDYDSPTREVRRVGEEAKQSRRRRLRR